MLIDKTPSASPAWPDVGLIRRSLERLLKEREDIIDEHAPFAAPNVDPVAWATTAATRRVVDQIKSALERLTVGTYGLCTRCSRAIVPGRLEALPYAETCIDCQNDVDR